jgi:phospholipid/cholesterol/gamma-HCH transport system permease protein
MATTTAPARPSMATAPARPPEREWLGPARELGDIVGFSARAVAAMPGSLRYSAEVLRQIGTLVIGSAVILLAMQAVIGGECGLFLVYLLRPLGATSAVGQLQVPCSLRELFPYMFGYIFAAKVGSGLVAEIGSMRISAEIDALESVGIDSVKYVIGTRLIAIFVFVPLIYIASLATGLVGGYLVTTVQLGALSPAQYLNGYFSSQSLADNLYSVIKALSIGGAISFVALYYGFKARGGPVGVGNAVARAMIVNLVLIHVIAAFWSAVFWGSNAGYPEGG